MISYRKISERIDKKFLRLISSYSKGAEYKVNMQKSVTLLYGNNEQVEFKIKNTIPFTLAPPKIK